MWHEAAEAIRASSGSTAAASDIGSGTTEGAEETQMGKVAAYLFGYLGPRRQQFKEAAE